MFIGHFGVGLGAKKSAPAMSLGFLFLAVQLLDLLWPTFLLFGWEHVKIEPGITAMAPLNFTHYPISHSLLMAVAWGGVIGALYFLIRKKYAGALVLALCVVSHWVLDWLVHRPDLPLYPGSSLKAGLGLWNHPAAEVAIEGIIFLAGLGLYLRATKAVDRIGSWGFWSMIVLLMVVHLGNLFGPPPPSVPAIAWAGETQWLFVVWAFWVDRHRRARGLEVPGVNAAAAEA